MELAAPVICGSKLLHRSRKNNWPRKQRRLRPKSLYAAYTPKQM
jgi:hypothetical protein